MPQRHSRPAAACLLSIGLAAMVPAAAQARNAAEAWQFDATIYG